MQLLTTCTRLPLCAVIVVRAANAAGAVGVRPGCDGSRVLPLVQARQLLHRVIVDHRILPCAPRPWGRQWAVLLCLASDGAAATTRQGLRW